MGGGFSKCVLAIQKNWNNDNNYNLPNEALIGTSMKLWMSTKL